jgi:hypothetical protein
MKYEGLKRHSVRGVKYNGEEICGGFAYYDADEVDAAIEELKAKLEDAKASHYAEMVDAGMRERRLRRALYKACANWAHIAVFFFSSYATKEKWYRMEHKCLNKAKEYK